MPIVLAACNDADAPEEQRVLEGDAEAGRAAIAEVECGVCHRIPGVAGANGIVGPPLDSFGRRQLIAGVLPNRPGVLVRWVSDAPSLVPNTGMPQMPLDKKQARDVAAYLYTLR
ncbi:c-type cytochrome [Chelativorans intermedius]|uniref:C-type cytochrome n=1 Tax=Chelativorans intermedius TaxID=515947 RepID=A0ABV6DBV4_9HYPH|nr:c-type cytochrome [Chelativorans intermedius]MCT9000307.1 c-type cytochrome [Chelativorans intermedius]